MYLDHIHLLLLHDELFVRAYRAEIQTPPRSPKILLSIKMCLENPYKINYVCHGEK